MRGSFRFVIVAAIGVAALAAPAMARGREVTLVFFEWDSTALTADAQQNVVGVAPRAKACEHNGIRIVGHADRSHTEEESAALGMARARAVRDALVKLGLADSAISVATNGELNPMKPTADGEREPLNRRAEIILVCD